MAKSVIINGVTYSNVPSVEIPLSSGQGNAVFMDTDIASGGAAASDIRNGAKAVVNGVTITGNVPEKSSSDLTVSGKTVTAPAGIYDSAASASVADGSVTLSASVSGTEIGDTVSDYAITVTPSATVSAGYVSGNKTGSAVTKYIQVQSANVTPSTSPQTITPTSGKLFEEVLVHEVDVSGTATEADVLAGKTFFSGGSLVRKMGNATVPTVSQDSTTKVLTVA